MMAATSVFRRGSQEHIEGRQFGGLADLKR